MTGKEILEFNRLLATEKNWSRGRECLDKNGQICDLNWPIAHQFSLDGALLRVVGKDRIHAEALILICCLRPSDNSEIDEGTALGFLIDYNDATSRDWASIKHVLMSLKATE